MYTDSIDIFQPLNIKQKEKCEVSNFSIDKAAKTLNRIFQTDQALEWAIFEVY